MITETLPSWQRELHQAISDPIFLLKSMGLSDSPLAQNLNLKPRWRLRVPKGYMTRMRLGDPDDPLLRQVLPVIEEQQSPDHFSLDPTGDRLAEKKPLLLHKYQGRVLLVMTGACAIHCRYCFRQHYTYSQPWSHQALLEAIRTDSSITEVILSGGDPLMRLDHQLSEFVFHLAQIPQVQRLRVHTRLPIVLPERVNETLLAWLTGTRLQSVVVVHTNHANELDASVNQALQRLVAAGITVLNQSVLLRGVNDNGPALIALSEALFSQRVLPYYLHQLDRVRGAAHFEVSDQKALQLLTQMRMALPGYLVPQLVREIADMGYKQPLFG